MRKSMMKTPIIQGHLKRNQAAPSPTPLPTPSLPPTQPKLHLNS